MSRFFFLVLSIAVLTASNPCLVYAQDDGITNNTQNTQIDEGISYTNIEDLRSKESTYLSMSPKEIVEALDIFLKKDVQVTDYEELLGNNKCNGLLGIALNKVYELSKNKPSSPYYDVIIEKVATLLFFLGDQNLKSDKRTERLGSLSTEMIELSKKSEELKRKEYYRQAASYANLGVLELFGTDPVDHKIIKEVVIQKLLAQTNIGMIELNLMFSEHLDAASTIITKYVQEESPYNFIKVLMLRKYLEAANSLMNSAAKKEMITYTFDERFAKRPLFETGKASQIDLSLARRVGIEITNEGAAEISKFDLLKQMTDKITTDVALKPWAGEAYSYKWETQRKTIEKMELKPCW